MLCMLIAYDNDGNVVATLDYMVAYDEDGRPQGLVNFEAVEELTDVWKVGNAKGSKTWPEWIGGHAHEFKVVLEGPPGKKHIAELVHKKSGLRRIRKDIEDRIANRMGEAKGKPVNITDIVGSPDRPLHIDNEGRSAKPVKPTKLPFIRRRRE